MTGSPDYPSSIMPKFSQESFPWHNLEAYETARRLQVDPVRGLPPSEIGERQRKYGLNQMSVRRGTPEWMKFLQQFNQALIYILLAATGVSALLGEWVDAGVIFGVVFINAVIGFVQESKAEKAIEALAKMVRTEATVRRDGRRQRVSSVELVPGDIVLLQSGDRVPADLRLFEVRSLQVEEAALTGESVPAQKDPLTLPVETVLGDRRNLAFAGTPAASAGTSQQAMQSQLAILSPEEDEALLREAGFQRVALFYAGLSFRGWVGYA